MDPNWLLFLIAAFGGGLFGAALGALPAFIFCGFAVIAGVAAALAGADYDFLGEVAFGPIFGPHVAFAGGVAATAYAKRAGLVEDGKGILVGLTGLDNPVVLLVGGVFGALGHLIQLGLEFLIGGLTDTVALTVFVSAVIARLAFGSTGIFGVPTDEARERGRFVPGGGNVWVPYQQDWLQVSVVGLGVGAISAFMFLSIAGISEELADAGVVLGFGIAAASLIFLQFGVEMPVTHHMALPAAYGALVALPLLGVSGAMVVGLVGGVLGAITGEVFSRLFLIHGDTWIDPPANGIWFMALVFFVAGTLLGTV